MAVLKKVSNTDAKDERNIVMSAIVSDACLSEIMSKDETNPMQTKIAYTVLKWCLNYFNSYEESPKEQIKYIFQENQDYIDEDLSENIEKFLESISDEYERSESFNDKYWLDQINKYYKKRAYKKLAKQLQDAEDGDEADQIYSNFSPEAEKMRDGKNVISSENIKNLRYEEEFGQSNYLFRMPGALGEMMGDIERDTFVGILGPEKIGKSYFLEEIALQGTMQGNNVVYFNCGDMSNAQLDRRFYSWLSKRRYGATEKNALIPVMDCRKNQNGQCEFAFSDNIINYEPNTGNEIGMKMFKDMPDHEPCIECRKDRNMREEYQGNIWWKEQKIKPWSWSDVLRKEKWFNKKFKGNLYQVSWPMESVRMRDIDNWIRSAMRDGISIDCVIIDYADIVLADNDRMDYRHQENSKWRAMRGISEKYHCNVTAATQADADSYNKKTLQLKNFSEDKRKYGHVTHFFSLNKTLLERKYKCMRVGTLLLREADIEIDQEVTVLQGLDMGRPYLGSFFGRVPGL